MEKQFGNLTIKVTNQGTYINVVHTHKDPYLYASREYPIEEAEWLQECLSTALQEIVREAEAAEEERECESRR